MRPLQLRVFDAATKRFPVQLATIFFIGSYGRLLPDISFGRHRCSSTDTTCVTFASTSTTVYAEAQRIVTQDDLYADREAHLEEGRIFGEEPFSEHWTKIRMSDPVGCYTWRMVAYEWQDRGVARNVNNLLETWVYAIAGRQREDLAVISSESSFGDITCESESRGIVKRGWPCVWIRTPHLCHFNSLEDFGVFMLEHGASENDLRSADSLTFEDVHETTLAREHEWLREFETDQDSAYQALSNILLWNRVQPWVKRDMRDVLVNAPEGIRAGPFVAFHIVSESEERGEEEKEEKMSEFGIEVYLQRAVSHVESMSELDVEEVAGVWIMAADPAASAAMKALMPSFFPSVRVEDVWCGGGVAHGGSSEESNDKYDELVLEMTDILQLTRADVFVGTSESDVGKLVALLRAEKGLSLDSEVFIDA